MITAVKSKLKQTLTSIDITPVYTDAEDEGKLKGIKYAWIYEADPERVIRDGNTLTARDDGFYLREYELRLKIGIRLAARNEPEAHELKTRFLQALAAVPVITDQQGFPIDLEVLTAEYITDKSILKTGSGYEIIIEATGGVYRDAGSSQADPWVQALCAWTKNLLPAPWRIYEFYPMGKPDITMYWQVVSVDVEEKSLSAYTVRKKMTGHIFARNDSAALAALTIAEGLQNDFKIPLNIGQKRFMTVHKPEVNIRNNPVTGGQVSVTLTRNTARPTEEFPLMGKVFIKEKLQEAYSHGK